MKILGYIIAIVGFIILFLNGKPRQWGKNGDGVAVWKHILIEIAAYAIMILGFTLVGKV